MPALNKDFIGRTGCIAETRRMSLEISPALQAWLDRQSDRPVLYKTPGGQSEALILGNGRFSWEILLWENHHSINHLPNTEPAICHWYNNCHQTLYCCCQWSPQVGSCDGEGLENMWAKLAKLAKRQLKAKL
ncbi:hypothetical protein C8J56DRAFT_1058426 [Mycena floridula]|nr:hypothetical protein C8J56DRAFT_1058426 [Mycena floridula]